MLRAAGLVALLLLYGMAVTEYDPGEPLLRGLALLGLVAAWLWLPRLPAREAAVGAAVVAGVGLRFRSLRRSTATAHGGTTAPGPSSAAARP